MTKSSSLPANSSESTGQNAPRGVAVQDVLHSLPPGSVKFLGYLNDRLEGVLRNRLLAQDITVMLEPFRVRKDVSEWNGEFWGKWFTGLALAARYSSDPSIRKKMDEAVRGLLETQTEDGYIGCHSEENRYQTWDVWGRKYTILGLLDHHAITGDLKSLAAAKRLADLTIDEIGPGKRSIVELGIFKGMASSSILEPMALLFQRTGETRYSDFCEYIVQEWGQPDHGPDLIHKAKSHVPVAKRFPLGEADLWFTRANGQHAYSLLTCYEGALHYFRSFGGADLLDASLATYEDIRTNELMVTGTGSVLECWCEGRKYQLDELEDPLESCTAILWIKFAKQLLSLTGETKFADDIEFTALNALIGSIKRDGSWCTRHNPLSGSRSAGPNQNGPLNCCVVNYPRALFLLPEIAVMQDAHGPVVNLYAPMRANVRLPDGNSVHIEQETDYPANGRVMLSVSLDAVSEFTLSLRIPSWSSSTSITVNGMPSELCAPGTYARLRRTWNTGDKVVLSLDMSPRVVYAPTSGRSYSRFRSGIVETPNSSVPHTAVLWGPVVLARDARLGGDVEASVDLRIEANSRIALGPLVRSKPDGIEMLWRVPTNSGEDILMCDYASAGSTWSDDSRYKVWLPVDAESGPSAAQCQ